ncbi:hypothetical protein E4U28_006750 [Claviceps purpurea]|nr:hypothetical protein E4U28_006750 [Claviceps purpurea]
MLAEYTNCFQVKAREEPLPTQYLTATALPAPSPTALVTVPGNEALFLDRRYVRADTSRGKTSGHGNKPFKKSCFVCRKPGCWSTNHTEQERRQEKARWWAEKNKAGTASEKKFSAFLQECEGSPHISEDSDDDDVKESDLVTWQLTGPAAFTADTNDTEKPELTFTQFFTHSPTPCTPESRMVDILRDNALAHAMFGEDP